MEIILQWLDDLDDLVFGVVLAVERLRWPCLKIGFTAACGLAAVDLADVLATWAPALVWTSIGSVMSWIAAVCLREVSWPAVEPSGSSV